MTKRSMTRGFGAIHWLRYKASLRKIVDPKPNPRSACVVQLVPGSILISGLSCEQLATLLLVLHCKRYTRRRRMYPQPCRVSHSASHPAHSTPHHLLYQASRKGLQLHGATRVAAQVLQQQQQQQQQQQDYETNLKQRQIAAREWIAPWLVCSFFTYQAKALARQQKIT